jgi:hypothetical protein
MIHHWAWNVKITSRAGYPLHLGTKDVDASHGRSRVGETRCHIGYTGHFSLSGTYSRLRHSQPGHRQSPSFSSQVHHTDPLPLIRSETNSPMRPTTHPAPQLPGNTTTP